MQPPLNFAEFGAPVCRVLSNAHCINVNIYIHKNMLLLCHLASLIQRNATCSYLNILFYVNKNPYDCYRIIHLKIYNTTQ